MKVTVEVYKVAAVGSIELDADKVEGAKEKALEMARAHEVVMRAPGPAEDFAAVIINATKPARIV